MRYVIAIWAMLILLRSSVSAANTRENSAFVADQPRAHPPPGPPFFRMMTRGIPNGYGLYAAIAQCPTGRDIVLRPAGGASIRPDPPVPQSPFYFVPQEFRSIHSILRVWISDSGGRLTYPSGPPGPTNPSATILWLNEWEEVQDMAVMLLLWMEETKSRRGRTTMPLERLWVTLELWSGPETAQMPVDTVTPWSGQEQKR
ncbi:hypothetical protein MMC26_003544 [Xylographa opegraphella]|nr:hypothetical protein [Xylographa opegraphella]